MVSALPYFCNGRGFKTIIEAAEESRRSGGKLITFTFYFGELKQIVKLVDGKDYELCGEKS